MQQLDRDAAGASADENKRSSIKGAARRAAAANR
jgi:hypothetical protein